MKGLYFLKSLYSVEAALDSYFWRLRKLKSKVSRCVLFATMPKSGSTFLSTTIANVLDYDHSYFASSYYNIEQELYAPRIVDSFGKGTVVQQHFRANPPNISLLNHYGIKPVVLYRNVFDALVSLRDAMIRDRDDNVSTVYTPEGFQAFNTEQQLSFLVKYFAPWLISFYASWQLAGKQGQIRFLPISYETCISDWNGGISSVLEFYEIPFHANEVEYALANPDSSGNRRFNKGIVGRGREILSSSQIKEIEELTTFYKDVDFAPIGIANA